MTTFDAPIRRPSPPRIDPLTVDAPHLLEWVDKLRPISIARFDSIGQEEYTRAFTSAGTVGSDIVADLYEEFRSNIAEKRGETDFKARVMPILREKGWLPELDDEALGRRVTLIFDANLRAARAAGKWTRVQANKALLPYIHYRAVMDARTRPEHAVLNHILLPVDHWFWERHWPPLGFGCRCIATQLSRSQAARWGAVTDEAKVEAAVLACGPTWANVGMIGQQQNVENVASANDRAVPGARPLVATALARAGQVAWGGVFGGLAERLTERLMATLRGETVE